MSISQTPSPATPADSPTPTPGRSIDVLGSLKKRWLLVAILFIPVAASSLPAAYFLGKPTYYTESVVYVSPRFLKNLQDDKEQELQSNSQYREYVQQQIRTINRYDICAETLKRLDGKIEWRKPKETEQHAIERLQSQLQVKPVLDTYQFTVGMEAEKPDQLAEIINTVVDVFLEKQKDEEFYAGDLRIDLLRKERQDLIAGLNEKSARKTAIAQEIGVTTFNGNLINPYDDLLVNQRKSLAAARQQRISADANFAAVAPTGNGRSRPALDAAVGEMVAGDSGLNALKSNLFVRRSELISKMSGLNADHPGRKAMEREIRDIDAEYERAVKKRSEEYAGMILEQRRAEQSRALQVETEIRKEVDVQATQAAAFTTRYNEALTLNDDIERLRKRLDSVDDRVDQLLLERKAPGFIRVFSPARTPEFPVKGSRRKIFLMVIGAAFALALVVPVGLDFLDPRIQSPGEVEKIAGFAPMGWITVPMDRDSRTLSGEQLNRVAIRLAREFRDHACRTVAMVGLVPGENIGQLTRNLTESLAEAGVTACSVEANPFGPGSDAVPGVTEFLRGTHDVNALLNGGPKSASVLSLGKAAEGTRLPNRGRFVELITELKLHYDLVLFETPPILESADTEFIAGICDLTLVVVEAWTVEKKDVTEAFRLIERLAPPSVGCVVTGIRTKGPTDRSPSVGKKMVGRWLWK